MWYNRGNGQARTQSDPRLSFGRRRRSRGGPRRRDASGPPVGTVANHPTIDERAGRRRQLAGQGPSGDAGADGAAVQTPNCGEAERRTPAGLGRVGRRASGLCVMDGKGGATVLRRVLVVAAWVVFL